MKQIGRIEDAVCLVIGAGLLIAGAAMVSVQLGMLAAGVLLLANAILGGSWRGPADAGKRQAGSLSHKKESAEVGTSKKSMDR